MHSAIMINCGGREMEGGRFSCSLEVARVYARRVPLGLIPCGDGRPTAPAAIDSSSQASPSGGGSSSPPMFMRSAMREVSSTTEGEGRASLPAPRSKLSSMWIDGGRLSRKLCQPKIRVFFNEFRCTRV